MNIKGSYLTSLFGMIINHVGYKIHIFVKNLSKKIKNTQSVLDVGAGTTPYRAYFNHCKYVSQDFCADDYGLNYDHIDIKSEVYDIPVEKESFDYILCTQVLEHLKYPRDFYKEAHRILKKGGELWISCPGAWEEHDMPFDFFRYTRSSLKMLGEEAGFKVVRVDTQGGRFIALGKMIKDLIPGMIKDRLTYTIVYMVQLPFVFPILVILFLLDKFDTASELTLNYEAVYKKK